MPIEKRSSMVGAAFRMLAQAFLWMGSPHQRTEGRVIPNRIIGTRCFISAATSWK